MKKLKKLLLGLMILTLVFAVMSCGKASVKMVKIPGRNFEMSQTEVTQGLYESIMEVNPIKFIEVNPSEFKGENNPVENVSWYDAIYFCNKFSLVKGYDPVYSVNGCTNINTWNYASHLGCSIEGEITQNLSANGYRLPTVEEWQYAAKGGQYYTYAGSNEIDEVAWYFWNSDLKTHPVAQKKPNGYRLYDMSGNVREWCWDSDYYSYYRYFCGDGYCDNASSNKVGFRDSYDAYSSFYDMGFRIVRTVTE